MKLKHVFINKYKSFLTSQNIDIEESVTRIVGKNESGKTAFLEALAKFNYFQNNDQFKFDKTRDYPRSELKSYEQKNPNNDFNVIKCVFELDKELLDKINSDLGNEVLTQNTIEISCNYNNTHEYENLVVNQLAFNKHFLSKYPISSEKLITLEQCTSVNELYINLSKDSELKTIADNLFNTYFSKSPKGSPFSLEKYIENTYLAPNLPKFWYFDDYFMLPAQISLTSYKNKTFSVNFSREQYDIASALFSLAGVDISKLITDQNHEQFISELEATSNSITDQLLEYWSTNKNLEIQFEIQSLTNDKLLNIRIRNTKHRVTLPLKNRSKGFIWFFSFLVWFSKIQNDKNIIVLLDEPGLSLHADAQNDLLRFIDEKLAPNYQVIYTTHSPFMIDSNKLHEVRTVYDSNDAKIGSIISSALEEKDSSTLFPLQAALGYDIAQNLYISSKNLLVEGVADLVYLTLISNKLRSIGKDYLDDDITIVPVGGLDKVATFISLLSGNKLNVACLLDTFIDQKGKARMYDLISDKIIKQNNIIFFNELIPNINPAEIEDMFLPKEYIELFNNEFREYKNIDITQINSNSSIVKQINKIIGAKRFNHYRPANYLSQNPQFLDKISTETLDRFSNAFVRINKLLK